MGDLKLWRAFLLQALLGPKWPVFRLRPWRRPLLMGRSRLFCGPTHLLEASASASCHLSLCPLVRKPCPNFPKALPRADPLSPLPHPQGERFNSWNSLQAIPCSRGPSFSSSGTSTRIYISVIPSSRPPPTWSWPVGWWAGVSFLRKIPLVAASNAVPSEWQAGTWEPLLHCCNACTWTYLSSSNKIQRNHMALKITTCM